MLELKQCCSVPFPEKLFEAYEIKDNVIYANVNASKVIDMIKRFVCMHDEPVFFILELPRKDYDGITESKTLKNAPEDFDVYYMDGMNAQNACDCLDAIGAFLVGDGMNTFGFGCHQSQEEILFGKYNVMTLFAKDPDAYRPFMESFEIPYTDKLITAWDTFDAQHPGECELCISPNTGKTIYDIPELYKDFGMYLYEERKEYRDGIETPITYDELIGKVLLFGITYYTSGAENGLWGMIILLFGAIFFFASDFTLGLRLIGGAQGNKTIKTVSLYAYFIAQLLLATSILFIKI
jgi:hypothetical protein